MILCNDDYIFPDIPLSIWIKHTIAGWAFHSHYAMLNRLTLSLFDHDRTGLPEFTESSILSIRIFFPLLFILLMNNYSKYSLSIPI
jgi:hypothetical protein